MLKLIYNPYRGSPLENVKDEKNISKKVKQSIEKIDKEIDLLNFDYNNYIKTDLENSKKIIVR